MTSSLPSSSGEFRRVLWTGLYSQVVLMTVPVGGDIGDEVFYTIYSPAEHNPQTVHKTEEEGVEEEESGKDEAPEWSQRSKVENEREGLVRMDGKY